MAGQNNQSMGQGFRKLEVVAGRVRGRFICYGGLEKPSQVGFRFFQCWTNFFNLINILNKINILKFKFNYFSLIIGAFSMSINLFNQSLFIKKIEGDNPNWVDKLID